MKYTYEQIYNYFKEQGCELLSPEYINNNTKLTYKCVCGRIAETRFRIFQSGARCQQCGYERMLETTKTNNNGIHHFQNQKFIEDRRKTCKDRYGVDNPLKNTAIKKKREETNLLRYGVPHVSQDPTIRENQKQGMKKNHGFEYTMQIPSVKYKQTLLTKYGVPSLAYLSNCASKESQKLFWEIHNKLPKEISVKNHFAKLNAEFVIGPCPAYYKYDFVNSILHKCIEYNGYNFHPKPEQLDDEINWLAFPPNTTVKEARDYENKKFQAIQSRGYKILVVCDYELHKNMGDLINKCLNFLLSQEILSGC